MSLSISVDEDLSIRLIEPQHAEAIFEAVDQNRVHVGRWLPWVAKTKSVDDVRAFCERSLRQFADGSQLAVSIIEHGRVVGGSGWTDWVTHNPDHLGLRGASADIGYWLIEPATGRGIMTRVVRSLVDFAFGSYGMHRLTIRAEPDNERSCAVPKRLGFYHEGTIRETCAFDGRWVGHHLFALLRREWDGAPEPLYWSHDLGDGLSLRLSEPRMSDELFTLQSDNREHLRLWGLWRRDDYSLEDERNHRRQMMRWFAERKKASMAVALGGAVVGEVALQDIDSERGCADISYWLSADAMGRGLMTRAVRGLVNVAFQDYGLRRLTIHTPPENKRSCALVQRLGFVHEGTKREEVPGPEPGKYSDLAIFALLRREWEVKR